ncbi:MAG: GTPase, partial [Thermoplasmata archaeon]
SSIILDIAFRRAYRATPHGAERFDRGRRRALLKMVRSTAVALRQLGLRTSRFRPDRVSEFERRLVDRRFGPPALPRSLERVRRAEERIRTLSRGGQAELRRASTEEEFGAAVRQLYGRLASFLREVDPDLLVLAEIDRFLKERPQLVAGVPTVVVAGYPNVGKSSLVARLSTARPEIAGYAFTTKSISVGHADFGFDRMQVVDTPGVLGRSRRTNPAEAEALEAVGHAGQVILFVLDPSEACGYPRADQEKLLVRWREEFAALPILEVETKADLPHPASGRLEVSAATGAGIDALRALLAETLRRVAPAPAMPPVEPSARDPAAEEGAGADADAPPEEPATGAGRKRRGFRR